MVNGRKAYHFEMNAHSTAVFSRIYAVDDKAVTYVDYEDLRPFNLQISIKESKQLAEARTLFDWGKLEADYWQKRITKEKASVRRRSPGRLVLRAERDLGRVLPTHLPAATGEEAGVRVADEGKNIVFKGEVLRRETIETAVGPLKTVVIQPQVTVDGVFSPMARSTSG